MCNLLAEGVLTAQKLLPERLSPYVFDEENYLRTTMRELQKRARLAVDVERDLTELRSYASRFPQLQAEFQVSLHRPKSRGRVRRAAERLGLRPRQTVDRIMQNNRVRRGNVSAGFKVSGEDFGFHDILGCAGFLERVLPRPGAPVQTGAQLSTAEGATRHSEGARGEYAG